MLIKDALKAAEANESKLGTNPILNLASLWTPLLHLSFSKLKIPRSKFAGCDVDCWTFSAGVIHSFSTQLSSQWIPRFKIYRGHQKKIAHGEGFYVD